MPTPPRGPAPNYTTAALVMGFVNLMVWLLVVWSILGYGAALLAAGAAHLIVGRRRQQP